MYQDDGCTDDHVCKIDEQKIRGKMKVSKRKQVNTNTYLDCLSATKRGKRERKLSSAEPAQNRTQNGLKFPDLQN
jgi:hypothetical protein